MGFSALQRAEIAEMLRGGTGIAGSVSFSALQRAEIAEIPIAVIMKLFPYLVSVLFNEPKLLKSSRARSSSSRRWRFSALQRAEIAEIPNVKVLKEMSVRFSALQRAEIAEMDYVALVDDPRDGFSALQRAEIAEMQRYTTSTQSALTGFSALQRAEIAEIDPRTALRLAGVKFQCSSTSRNC